MNGKLKLFPVYMQMSLVIIDGRGAAASLNSIAFSLYRMNRIIDLMALWDCAPIG